MRCELFYTVSKLNEGSYRPGDTSKQGYIILSGLSDFGWMSRHTCATKYEKDKFIKEHLRGYKKL